MKIRQNPIFPTTPLELVRELSVLWRELATSFDSLETTVSNLDTTVDGLVGTQMTIKAIYRSTITINNGSASNTATITAVVPEMSILTNLGAVNTGASDGTANVRLELIDSTTITAYKNSGDSGAVTVGYQLVEYE